MTSPMGRRSSLPDDIIIFLLLNLPIKSLLRFKSICKSWYSSINDPEFIKLHLHKSYISRQKFLLVANFENLPSFKYDHSPTHKPRILSIEASLSVDSKVMLLDPPFPDSATNVLIYKCVHAMAWSFCLIVTIWHCGILQSESIKGSQYLICCNVIGNRYYLVLTMTMWLMITRYYLYRWQVNRTVMAKRFTTFKYSQLIINLEEGWTMFLLQLIVSWST